MAVYHFSSVPLHDLEGKPVKGAALHKTLANALYMHSNDLGLVEIAQKMYKGEGVEIDKSEIEEVKKLIDDPKIGLAAFARKALHDYITSIKK